MHYRKNQCRHGMKGTNCLFLHPERCKKLILHGTKQPEGCNLGKKCSHFHPKMCPSSITKRICLDEKCQFTHVKGTKRTSRQQKAKTRSVNADLKEKPGSNSPEGKQVDEGSPKDSPTVPDDFLSSPADDQSSNPSFFSVN